MALTAPYRQHHYLGEIATESAALTFIQANKWDSTNDGTGDPQNGMLFYDTTLNVLKVYANGSWTQLTQGTLVHNNLTDRDLDDNHLQYTLVDGTRDFTGDQSMGGFALTNVAYPTNATDAATKEYVDQGKDWQESVIDFYDPTASTPPGPSVGDRYISTATANGWTDNYIYEWNGTSWVETVPDEGTTTRNETDNKFYVFDGASWGEWAASTEHNATSGLQGGTTNEYYHLTSAQSTGLTGGGDTALHTHDDRYYTESEIGSTTGGSEGASLVGTDSKTNLNNATDVETALTELNTRNPSGRSTNAGNPNGVVSGAIGDFCFDTTNDIGYYNIDGTNSGWVVM